jgi:hypothetical protein
MGHRSLPIVFRNTADHPCTVDGYPTLTAVSDGGTYLATAVHTPRGYLGGYTGSLPPPRIVLAPGATASVLVEALGFIQATGNAGTPFRILEVQLPGDPVALHVPWAGTDACDALEVHPFVRGDNGSS